MKKVASLFTHTEVLSFYELIQEDCNDFMWVSEILCLREHPDAHTCMLTQTDRQTDTHVRKNNFKRSQIKAFLHN